MALPKPSPLRRSAARLIPVLPALLLLLMAVLAGGAALRESLTFDEMMHIGAGVSYVQRLELRLNPEHPPLAKVAAALPLVLRGAHADYSDASWAMSRNFFPAFIGQMVFGELLVNHWNQQAGTLAWARLPMLLLTLALGWALYSYARRLGGNWGGLLSLTAFVSMPVFLAFGPLVHTDVAVTLFSVLALWTFAKLWEEPGRGRVLLFALSLAGALLSKFTGVLLFFALAGFGLTLRLRALPAAPSVRAEAKAWRRRRWRATWKGVLWALLIVYAFYLVFSWNQSTGSLALLGHSPLAVGLRRLLLPPWLYLRGMSMVAMTASRPTFILGHGYPHGVWFYFPVLLLLKSPLGFLGLLATALALAVGLRRREPSVPAIEPGAALYWRIAWVSLVVYTAACLVSRVNIGFRHFTIPLALLILLLAPLPRMLARLRAAAPAAGRLMTALTVTLAVLSVAAAVGAYPYYFPYANSLTMGRPAYTLFSDSNLDWDQALPEVRRFAQKRGIQSVPLDAYGLSDSRATVPQSYMWNCQAPAAEDAGRWAVISANMILDIENCRWLMQYPNAALGGGSMYAIRLPAPIPPAGAQGGPPLPAARRTMFPGPNGEDARLMFISLIEHPDRVPKVGAEIQQTVDEFSGKALERVPWLKKRLAETAE
jgi:4-amino-4-deoxy-L-arabinose transferase-like glycosyltransferase